MPFSNPIKSILLPFLLLLFYSTLWAASPVVLEEGNGKYPLGKNMDILEDKEGKWTIEDVGSLEFEKKWVPSEVKVPSFGYTDSVYWVRFQMVNTFTRPKDWLLEMAYPRMNYMVLYAFDQNGNQLMKKRTGSQFIFNQRETTYRNFVFNLNTEQKKPLKLYMRFQTQGSMQLPLSLWKPSAFAEHVAHENYVMGLYFGMMVVMIFYNLILFLSVRDKGYQYYVLYIIGLTIVLMAANGLAYQYLWPNFPWLASRSVPFFVGFLQVWNILFTQDFLNTKQWTPKLHQLLSGLILVGVLLMVFSLFADYAFTIKLAVFSGITCSLALLICGIISLAKGVQSARYYMLAFTALLLGAILRGLETAGILPSIFITDYGIQIGSAVEVILLSLGLGARFNEERKEKYLAQKQTLQAERKMLEALESSNRVKDELIANVSHELRTPMTGILGFSELLKMGAVVENEKPSYYNQIFSASERLIRILNNFIHYSQLASDSKKIIIKPICSHDVVSQLGHYWQDKIAIESESFEFHSDLNLLEIVISELIHNGLTFNQSETPEVTVQIQNKKEGIQIIVSDNGLGIDSKHHQPIFDRFFRVDSGLDYKVKGGVGLGLAIAQKGVQLLKGSIEMESQLGEGSTFSVKLPKGDASTWDDEYPSHPVNLN